MGDIKKAVEKEKEYLSYRTKGEEPFHLVDAINECGFDSLAAYFEAKKTYEFEHLDFEVFDVDPEGIGIYYVSKCIIEKRTAYIPIDVQYTFVWVGDGSAYNAQYCSDCGIPAYPIHSQGGAIVNAKGDFNVAIVVPESIGVNAEYFLHKLADILQSHTDRKIEVVGNDVLLDGQKVLGSSTATNNDMFSFVAAVSLVDKAELISQICTKHSSKTPAYIDFLTCDELESEVRKWLNV